MSLFASDRERRLWFWAVAVVVGIYSTLGLAQKLAGALRDTGAISASFWVGLFLIGAAILMQGLRSRPGGAEIGVALGVAGVYLIAFLRMTAPEERSHIIEYSVVALLVYDVLVERARQGRRVPIPAVNAVVITAMLGAIDEGIRSLLPNRWYDIRDVGFNALASVMAVAASLALAWARRRFGRSA